MKFFYTPPPPPLFGQTPTAGAVRGVRRAGQFVLDLRAGTVDGDAGHTRIGRPRWVLILLPLRKPGEAFFSTRVLLPAKVSSLLPCLWCTNPPFVLV